MTWWESNPRKPGVIDELHVVHGYDDGGCVFEFGFELHEHGILVRVWDDAWQAFAVYADLFQTLAGLDTSTNRARKLSMDVLERHLLSLTFEDTSHTKRVAS